MWSIQFVQKSRTVLARVMKNTLNGQNRDFHKIHKIANKIKNIKIEEHGRKYQILTDIDYLKIVFFSED